jgi:hypothetical protein
MIIKKNLLMNRSEYDSSFSEAQEDSDQASIYEEDNIADPNDEISKTFKKIKRRIMTTVKIKMKKHFWKILV